MDAYPAANPPQWPADLLPKRTNTKLSAIVIPESIVRSYMAEIEPIQPVSY